MAVGKAVGGHTLTIANSKHHPVWCNDVSLRACWGSGGGGGGAGHTLLPRLLSALGGGGGQRVHAMAVRMQWLSYPVCPCYQEVGLPPLKEQCVHGVLVE